MCVTSTLAKTMASAQTTPASSVIARKDTEALHVTKVSCEATQIVLEIEIVKNNMYI